MKKLSILLGIVLMLALPLTAMAGSAYSNARADFEPVEERGVDDAWGHAIINYTKGQGAWEVSGSLHNLLEDHDYIVEVGTEGESNTGVVVAEFTTDSGGKGNFHSTAEGLPGSYNVVRIIDSEAEGWSPWGDIKMVARENGTLGLLQFRGQGRGE